jgi:transcriptional regulator with XRE-family HTH domain
MDAAQAVKAARTEAGLSQRRLAVRSGVPQSAIARIESGRVIPRVDTLSRLLRAAGASLEVQRRPPGWGVDRTQIRELLKLTPAERVRLQAASSRNLHDFYSKLRPK